MSFVLLFVSRWNGMQCLCDVMRCDVVWCNTRCNVLYMVYGIWYTVYDMQYV